MSAMTEPERQRMAVQARLDGQKTAAERNEWGQFATPPHLAAEIAGYLYGWWKRNGGRRLAFFDPAIGTGSFFSALLTVIPKKAIGTAAGAELDTSFADAASQLWAGRGLEVLRGDFTRLAPSQRYDFILTNPPYVRHHHLDADVKRTLAARIEADLQLTLSGLAGLYCYFLLLCDRWMATGGFAAWLVPSEFMSVNYGKAVKQYLKRHVTLLHIHRFAPQDVQFADALVSSAVVVFRKSPPPPSHKVLFSFGGSLSAPDRTEQVSLDDLDTASKWTRFAERDGRVDQNPDSPLLGDLFQIKRGLATGDNGYFVLRRTDADRIGIPVPFQRPILPSPRYLQEDVIESLADGYPAVRESLCLIDCSLPPERVKEHYPRFWAYLEKGMAEGVHAGYLASRREPWYSQERRAPAPFVCTYMGRTTTRESGSPFRFLWNKSQATAANVYLCLYPRPKLATLFASQPDLAATIFTLLQTITAKSFLDESRVYGGGLYKLEPKELARVNVHEMVDAIGALSRKRQKQFMFIGS
ncbi:MAG: Eco57I restriction-modification methylase domain-containing protein [Planctomycetaceae bacterium]